ncbi:MAG: hypothetical protein WCI73_11970 [Phycisphaerae bacterium]
MPAEVFIKLLDVHPAPWKWRKVSPLGSIADSVLILDAHDQIVATMHESDGGALAEHGLGWSFTAEVVIGFINQAAR